MLPSNVLTKKPYLKPCGRYHFIWGRSPTPCCLGWVRKKDCDLISFLCRWLPIAILAPPKHPDWGVPISYELKIISLMHTVCDCDRQGEYHTCSDPRELHLEGSTWAAGAGRSRWQNFSLFSLRFFCSLCRRGPGGRCPFPLSTPSIFSLPPQICAMLNSVLRCNLGTWHTEPRNEFSYFSFHITFFSAFFFLASFP